MTRSTHTSTAKGLPHQAPGTFTQKGAFTAQETNIGGAHLILSDYMSFHRRVAAVSPTAEVVRTRQAEPTFDAQRLSRNRAAKQGASAWCSLGHRLNTHHMARRIEEMYTRTERKKNVLDPSVYPTMQSRPKHSAASLHSQLQQPWKEGYGYSALAMSPRPGSAPAGWATRTRNGREEGGDHYQGWSVTTSMRDAFPADDFPLTQYLKSPVNRMEMTRSVYKQIMLAEIVESRLYKNTDIKQLFSSYVKRAPLHDKQAVEAAVAELKQELLVRDHIC